MNWGNSILRMSYIGLLLSIFALVYFWIDLKQADERDLVLPDSQILTSDNTSSVALYEAKTDGHAFFLTIDDSEGKNFISENSDRYKLKSLHRGDFWDPKRCSQMQSIVSSSSIIFLDSVVSQESKTDFISLLYLFDTNTRTLKKVETEIKLLKIFRKVEGNGEGIYAIAFSKKKLGYSLYKIDEANNKLIFIKNYYNLEDYNLLTATDTLAWCKNFGRECVYDNDFNFSYNNNDVEEYRAIDNAFETKIILNKREIFRVKDNDVVRYFFIGLKDLMNS